MNNEHYAIYSNNDYIKALFLAIKGSPFDLNNLNQAVTDAFITCGYNRIIDDVKTYQNNITVENVLKCIEKSYFIMASREYAILNYYSEYYKKYYFIEWDDYAFFSLMPGTYSNFLENYRFDLYLSKPNKLNFVRRCNAMGLIYSPLNKNEDIDIDQIEGDIYLKALLTDYYRIG
jgi:hypothetical protein